MLLVALRVRNTSDVLFRREDSEVRLMNASAVAEDGSAQIVLVAVHDPFLAVYGYEADQPERRESRSLVPVRRGTDMA